MADIKLNDLQPVGSEFFADNEGYLNDLSEDELTVWGGTGGGGSNQTQVGLVNIGLNDVNVAIPIAILGSNLTGQV